MITTLYAALLALLFVALTARTILLRNSLKVSLGDAGNSKLMRAIRVHANFAEFVPICLILIYLVETNSAYRNLIHVLGSALLVARMSHAYGVSQENEKFIFRMVGMITTFSVIIVASLVLLSLHFF